MYAATGVSRSGVSALLGLSNAKVISSWVTQGLAQPERDPWGEFALKFRQAEQLHETMGTTVQHQTVQAILRKRPAERSMAEIMWVDRHLARRYPKDHGSGEGLAQFRQLTPDADIEAWWQEQGLEQEQLQALLREPPETLALALVAEADALFRLLCERGWKPPRRVKT